MQSSMALRQKFMQLVITHDFERFQKIIKTMYIN